MGVLPYIKPIIIASQSIEKEMSIYLSVATMFSSTIHPSIQLTLKFNSTYLRLDQNEINKHHHIVIFDIFIREPSATGTLRQPDSLSQGPIVCSTVGAVQM